MHSLKLLCLMIIAGAAVASPLLEYGAPPAGDSVSQYHTQDEHGQYSYGYVAPLYSKHETRTVDGVIRGTFSYVDARGETQTTDYVADTEGFRVSSSHGQLQANEETPEVAALRAQHLAAHAQAKLRLAGDASGAAVELPQPVQDTPEVAAAKVAFFKRFEAEKLRNQLLSEKQLIRVPVTVPTIAVRSQPLYVHQPLTGYVYNFHKSQTGTQSPPSRDYLPVRV